MPSVQGRLSVRRRPNDGAAGADGKDAVRYWLVPSVTQVKKSKSGTLTPSSLTCAKMMQCGNLAPVSAGSEASIKYSVRTASSTGAQKAYSGAIAITATTVAVEFVLLVDSTQVDSCTVAVVADGADGRPGLDGNPGKDGLAGCIQRLSEWAEGVYYRNDEALTSGTRFLDIVTVTKSLTDIDVYQCLETHGPSNSGNAPNPAGSTRYWRKFEVMSPIYTPLIVAQYAKLRFAQSNQLLIMDESGKNIIAGMGGGTYPLFLGGGPDTARTTVDMKGIIETGVKKGQRVVLDPTTMDMQVFNNDNEERIRVTGADTSVAEAVPGTSGRKTANVLTGSNSSLASNSSVQTYKSGSIVSGGTVTRPTVVSVRVPNLTLYAKGVRSSGSGATAQLAAPLTVNVDFYRNVGGTRTWIAGATIFSQDQLAETEASETTATFPAVTREFVVAAGKSWSIEQEITYHISGTTTGAQFRVTANPGYLTYESVTQETKSVHTGNGIALSQDSRNFFYSLMQDGLGQFAFRNDDFGIRINDSGLWALHPMSGWSKMGHVLFAGPVEFSSTKKGKYVITDRNRAHSDCGAITCKLSVDSNVRVAELSCEAWKVWGTEWNQDRVVAEFSRIMGTPGASGFVYAISTTGSGQIQLKSSIDCWAFVTVRIW